MSKIILITLAITLTGCANMTPGQKKFWGAVVAEFGRANQGISTHSVSYPSSGGKTKTVTCTSTARSTTCR